MSVVCQIVVQQTQFDNDRINEMFAYLWQHSFPYFESEFLNIISLRAIQAAFEEKGLMNPEEKFIVQKFAKNFLDKVDFISEIVTFTVFVVFVVVFAIAAAFFSENILWKIILGVFAALGLGASFFGEVRDWLKVRLTRLIKWFWGYTPPTA